MSDFGSKKKKIIRILLGIHFWGLNCTIVNLKCLKFDNNKEEEEEKEDKEDNNDREEEEDNNNWISFLRLPKNIFKATPHPWFFRKFSKGLFLCWRLPFRSFHWWWINPGPRLNIWEQCDVINNVGWNGWANFWWVLCQRLGARIWGYEVWGSCWIIVL